MEWIQAHAVEITALCGAFLAIWNVVSKLDTALIAHLDDKFASKADLIRIERKSDQLLPRKNRLTSVKRDDDGHDSERPY